ncbi:hypothetical protein NP493_1012g00004 [Ridgeia piscesae]|uniref:EGF-like domain-containing protein n=1 Tax=Ridgeia piscesae TaxID=27915 RepID=A0AAD9KK08_RIDPI|nr:hypothetical protein NP493_1012g00004 [Ridgeia piscesae]
MSLNRQSPEYTRNTPTHYKSSHALWQTPKGGAVGERHKPRPKDLNVSGQPTYKSPYDVPNHHTKSSSAEEYTRKELSKPTDVIMQKFTILLCGASLIAMLANVNAGTVDPCLSNPCGDGGTCVNRGDFYTCICKWGHKCPHCQDRPNLCNNDPCKNGGKCSGGPHSYKCTCKRGYTGVNCERHVRRCDIVRCFNGGTRVETRHGCKCRCASAFTGRTCTISPRRNKCDSNPCQNGGTCSPRGHSYVCRCRRGFSGPKCHRPGDCSRCNVTANSVGYLEDVCDCSKYYQCQRIGNDWTAYRRHCPACLRWDQTTLTCSIRIAGCTLPTSTTPNPETVTCDMRAVSNDDTKYLQVTESGSLMRSCPGGTVFDQSQCACVAGQPKVTGM